MANGKTIAGLVVMVVGISALGISVWRMQPEPVAQMTTTAEPPGSSALAKSSKKVDESFVVPIAQQLEEKMPPPTLPKWPELKVAATEVLKAYASPDIQSYLDLMQKQGIEPSERIAADPEAAQGYWDMTRALLATATIDHEGITILHAVRNGQKQYPNDETPFFQLRRDEGRPFLSTLSPIQTEVAELRIPGEFPTSDGSTFAGDLTIQFTFNPNTNKWILTEFRVAGVPNGSSVMIPPL